MNLSVLLAAFLVPVLLATAFGDVNPTLLRCEYRDAPTGIDRAKPRFSWRMESDQRGARQSAYQICAATSSDALAKEPADLWDSGKVVSDQSLNVEYAGQPLKSIQQVWWKVRVWDAADKPSAWSKPTHFSTGLLAPGDWTAKWIMQADAKTDGPLPMFRKSFRVEKPIARATIFICGLGHFDLRVNGKPASEDVLEPGWTNYKKTCLYVTYDLTSQLQQGENAIGVMLGNGMYHVPADKKRYAKWHGSSGQPKLIAQLRIDYADGTSKTIGSDDSWKATSGPVKFSSVYGGEDFDARIEPAGWDSPEFNESKWTPAAVTQGPGGALYGASRSALPIRVIEVMKPKSVTQPKPGVFVYDLGQNCSQMPQITVSGSAGATVRLVPGELLNKDGTVSQASSGQPMWYAYTLKGGASETWSPKFFYYGARYVQVEHAIPAGEANPGNLPIVSELVGKFITSSSPMVGEFSCSNDLFNRTETIIRWAMRSNMMSLITDCPHREKLGWLEQDHLVGPSMMYAFDTSVLMSKICTDMADSQTAEGLVPDIAPEFTKFGGGFRDSPEWGSACVLIPWQIYTQYGDTGVLAEQYETMKRYVAYLGTKAKDNILSHGLGDWYDLGPKRPGEAQLTPRSLTATAFYYRDAFILARVAKLLGKSDDEQTYTKLAGEIRESFNHALYDAQKHTYATGSQCSNAIPLVFDLVPKDDRAAVVENLVADIRSRDNRLTAGDIGYRYLLRALAEGGRSDIIFDMNSRSDRPGYGYILSLGSTSLTEGWDGSSSQNHFMLGHIMEWFYRDLAGIDCDPETVAYKKIVIHPSPAGDVTWAKASFDSPHGKIASSWRIEGGKFMLDVTIPSNTSAKVMVPTKRPGEVTEGGKSLAQVEGIKVLASTDAAAVCEIGSGSYHFEATR